MARKITPRDVADIQLAQSLAQSGSPELLQSEEVRLLNELVSAYNSGKLTDRDAAIGIAVIARIRRVFNKIQQAIVKGTDIGLNLTR